jgi:hypothetical protein
MAPHPAEPIDAVYTWVDGTWDGYDALLRAHARNRHDLNPNRYRDNLSTMKYSLRSLEQFAPWIRRVFLVTSRPQKPAWLDDRAASLVHHDAFMPTGDLPTFNSFAIVSNLHRIEGLSRRFVYIEDDRLFGAAVRPADLFDERGRPRVFLTWLESRDPRDRDDARLSPWNRALAFSNLLLDERYDRRRRATVSHAPLPVDIDSWRAMTESWADAFARTSSSRFRDTGNVAPEHLYPHYLLEERLGTRVPWMTMRRQTAYHPLNNIMPFQRLGLLRIDWQRPKFFCLNDDFGGRPNESTVALARQTLDRWYPRPSRFELS